MKRLYPGDYRTANSIDPSWRDCERLLFEDAPLSSIPSVRSGKYPMSVRRRSRVSLVLMNFRPVEFLLVWLLTAQGADPCFCPSISSIDTTARLRYSSTVCDQRYVCTHLCHSRLNIAVVTNIHGAHIEMVHTNTYFGYEKKRYQHHRLWRTIYYH